MLLNIGHSVHCKGYTVYTVYLSEMGKNVCYGIKKIIRFVTVNVTKILNFNYSMFSQNKFFRFNVAVFD